MASTWLSIIDLSLVALQSESSIQRSSSNENKREEFVLNSALLSLSFLSRSTHYGLEIAKLVDLPKDLLLHASEIANSLSELAERAEKSTQTSAIVQRRKIVMKVS